MLNPHFKEMLSALSEKEVEFLVIGAYALAAHGVPRATGDIDIWVHRTETNADRIMHALKAFGAPTDQIKASDFLIENLVFQIGVEPQRIDILTSVDGVEFEQAWAQRVTMRISDIDVPLVSIAHLLENKRATGRPRDLADVAEIEARRISRGNSIPPS